MGYLIVPPHLCDRMSELRYVLDFHPPMSIQPVLASFLSDGHLESHARRMHRLYRSRRDALIAAFDRHLRGELTLTPISSGLSAVSLLSPRLATDVGAAKLTAAAEDAQVTLTNLSYFYSDPADAPQGHLLGFGSVDEALIERAAIRLAATIARLR